MTIKLSGKTAVITGAASGIGKAIAVLLAEAGAYVHIIDLSGSEAVTSELIGKNAKASGHTCDVSNQAEVNKVVNSIISQHPIHILVNCAGIAHVGNLEKTS